MKNPTLQDIYEVLAGNPLEGTDGVVKDVKNLKSDVSAIKTYVEKQIEKEKEKVASKMAFRKFLSAITLGLIKMKTGL